MYYSDSTAMTQKVKAPDSVRIYKDTFLKNCILGEWVTVGDRSRLTNCIIDEHAIIQRDNLILDSFIGKYTSTMHGTTIFDSKIGSFCAISWGVSIGGAAHNYKNVTIHGFISCKDFGLLMNDEGFDLYTKPVTIGNDVWIAAGACVNRGVVIGDGAVIGANSVVTHDVEPYSIVAGCPAHEIKKRFSDDAIMRIKKIKWWEFPKEVLQKNIDLFSQEMDEHKLQLLEEISDNLRGGVNEIYSYRSFQRNWKEMCKSIA